MINAVPLPWQRFNLLGDIDCISQYWSKARQPNAVDEAPAARFLSRLNGLVLQV